MNVQGLLNTPSPKLTVPQVSDHASGAASSTASRSAKLSVTAPPVESWTIRSVPSRSAATVSVSRPRSRVGRAVRSLIWTWTTAAPAASHSLAVATSSSRVTGRAGTCALSASAPVGATVMSVLAAMARRLPAGPRAALILDWRLSAGGLPRRQRQVLAGEGQRLGQIGQAGLAIRRPVGVHLDHHRAAVPGRGQQAEQFGARLGTAPGHQVLVGERPGRRPGAVG